MADLGSHDQSILVTGNSLVAVNPGSVVNVRFVVWNRPDSYYNTYVYVDNVRLELQGRSSGLGNEAPSLPETQDGYMGR